MRSPVQIVAVTIEVRCPHCGDPIPSPTDESHIWTPFELSTIAKNSPRATCNACDEPILFHVDSKAQVEL